MKTNWVKRLCLWVLICAVTLSGIYCLLRFGFSFDILDQSGWDVKGGTVRYLDYWGRPQLGWQQIEDDYYYFELDHGSMITGWYTVDGTRYHFAENGVRTQGWLKTEEGAYYFDENGVAVNGWLQWEENSYYLSPEEFRMVTGWSVIDGSTYHFNEEGILSVGWFEENGNRYYLDENGVMVTGWLELDEGLYYLAPDGDAVSGWYEVDGVRYCFGEDSALITGWFEDDSGRYFFCEDGKPYNGWLDWEQKRYYLNDDGSVTTGWLSFGQDRYYFLPNGRMAIGEVEIDGESRFFTSSGKEVLLCNTWHPIPEDYELDLVDHLGFEFDRVAAAAFEEMVSDAEDADIEIEVNNGYRAKWLQQYLWDESVIEFMDAGYSEEEAIELTAESIAIPGHSEHGTGLAMDVYSGYMVYEWLAENCWDYGFILRYPEGKTDVTGIIYEPWHFRYVGTELSLELQELGLCLEEYMTILTEQQANIAD